MLVKPDLEIVGTVMGGRQFVHLVRQYEKQFIAADIELLQVYTMRGAALQHKKEKVVRFTVH